MNSPLAMENSEREMDTRTPADVASNAWIDSSLPPTLAGPRLKATSNRKTVIPTEPMGTNPSSSC